VSGVVLRVGNSRLPHESLARKTLDFVLRPRAVSIVGKLCQVVHGHNAELADFFECVNLGIPEASIPCSGPYTWFGFVGLGFAPSRASGGRSRLDRSWLSRSGKTAEDIVAEFPNFPLRKNSVQIRSLTDPRNKPSARPL
jgi:hypothetical protein